MLPILVTIWRSKGLPRFPLLKYIYIYNYIIWSWRGMSYSIFGWGNSHPGLFLCCDDACLQDFPAWNWNIHDKKKRNAPEWVGSPTMLGFPGWVGGRRHVWFFVFNNIMVCLEIGVAPPQDAASSLLGWWYVFCFRIMTMNPFVPFGTRKGFGIPRDAVPKSWSVFRLLGCENGRNLTRPHYMERNCSMQSAWKTMSPCNSAKRLSRKTCFIQRILVFVFLFCCFFQCQNPGQALSILEFKVGILIYIYILYNIYIYTHHYMHL